MYQIKQFDIYLNLVIVRHHKNIIGWHNALISFTLIHWIEVQLMLMPEDNHWQNSLTYLPLSLHKGLAFHTKSGQLMLAQAQKS
jgi:hypothetical protein